MRRTMYRSALAAVVLLAAFNVLWRMTAQNIGDWDEGRHAVSAYEMLQRGDLLVNTWRGAVDYWNLKPPLSFWPLIAAFHVLGPSTFALRLPSAVFFIVTVVCVAVYARRTMGRTASVVAAAATATCYPIIGSHSGRTADPDALFVMLTTVALLAVFGAPEHPRLLPLWTLAAGAAFLTKSWHAGLVLVIGIIFLTVRGRRSAVGLRHWAVALVGLVPVLLWAAARLHYDGLRFFTAMVQYDLLSRSSGAIEANTGGPAYYIVRLVYLAPWMLVLVGVLVGRTSRRTAITTLRARLAGARWRTAPWLGPLIAAIVVLGAFSVASTKLPWYAYAAFPMLALVIGAAASGAAACGGRRGLALVVAASVVAAGAGEAYVLRKIPAPIAPAQAAMAALRDEPTTHGLRVWLDPELQARADDLNERERAKVGDWPQSLRASALINAGLHPQEGEPSAFESKSGRRLIVVLDGSAADAEVRQGAVLVAHADGASVLEAR